ncbi:MAG: PSD1 and planctomycete cytochrome C domain-containing protein [Planctomycetaceae bacterium]
MPACQLRTNSLLRVPFHAQACVLILLAICSASVLGQDGATEKSAADPFTLAKLLLEKHCYSCHGPEKQEGNLRLDTLQGLSLGGKSGAVLVPGKADESLLVTAVRRTDPSLEMPPEEKLSESEVQILVDWIQQGAKHPEGQIVLAPPKPPFDVNEARKFWAFQPLQPTVPDSERHAIDHWVSRSLAEKGLRQNPKTDKLTLIRRATFDLTGLPPSRDDIRQFLEDDSPDAYAKLIDRLLESPQYGERWARHWLDVVRYADSNGLDENIAHGNAWRYRNYVIDSLNRDKPFDVFLREQIAGDLMIDESTDEATRIERLTATGFLSLGPKVLAEGDETKMQLDIIDEQIDTIGKSMLGLTLGCARCHDHKFDPISQADYYALSGIFQSTKTMESLKRIAKWNENSIATASDRQALEQHQAKIAAKKSDIDNLLKTATASAGDAKNIPEDQLSEDVRKQLASLREELKTLEQSVPELPTAMGVTDGTMANGRILPRGNHLAPGRLMNRTIPVVLDRDGSFSTGESHSGRLEFAQWLTSEKNPLTARVIANRVWRWHFGRGLVATADNFGKLGEAPTHPELLEWLASELVRSGWSLKALHRQILLSETYQASSESNPDAEAVDPDNRWLWRWMPRRLEAESVRDSVLAATGVLDRSMGTSMLHVKNREFLFDHTSKDLTKYDSNRRSIYLPVIRNNLYDAMSLFDCTDGTVPNGDRASSTVASQALFFMNSSLVIQAADECASRLIQQFPDGEQQRVEQLYWQTLGRGPSDQERQTISAAIPKLTSQLQNDGVPESDLPRAVWTCVVQTLLMSNEFLYVK